MPVAVIVSGKMLAIRFRLTVQDKQWLKIPLPYVAKIQATGAEVILGFSGFFLTLFVITVPAGRIVYEMFRYQFGIDPGQFNSLCIFSSFATVVWSSIAYALSATKSGPLSGVSDEHKKLIEDLSENSEEEDKNESPPSA